MLKTLGAKGVYYYWVCSVCGTCHEKYTKCCGKIPQQKYGRYRCPLCNRVIQTEIEDHLCVPSTEYSAELDHLIKGFKRESELRLSQIQIHGEDTILFVVSEHIQIRSIPFLKIDRDTNEMVIVAVNKKGNVVVKDIKIFGIGDTEQEAWINAKIKYDKNERTRIKATRGFWDVYETHPAPPASVFEANIV